MVTLAEVENILEGTYPLPAPYHWKLENYCADYDAGFWSEGSGVKVGVAKPIKLLKWDAFATGTLIIMVPPVGTLKDFEEAAQKIYTHASLYDRGVLPEKVAPHTVTA